MRVKCGSKRFSMSNPNREQLLVLFDVFRTSSRIFNLRFTFAVTQESCHIIDLTAFSSDFLKICSNFLPFLY